MQGGLGEGRRLTHSSAQPPRSILVGLALHPRVYCVELKPSPWSLLYLILWDGKGQSSASRILLPQKGEPGLGGAPPEGSGVRAQKTLVSSRLSTALQGRRHGVEALLLSTYDRAAGALFIICKEPTGAWFTYDSPDTVYQELSLFIFCWILTRRL